MAKRQKFFSVLSVAVLAFAGSVAARAADAPLAYPQRVVTLVTHSSPGAGSDVFLRQMVKYLQRYIKATLDRKSTRLNSSH